MAETEATPLLNQEHTSAPTGEDTTAMTPAVTVPATEKDEGKKEGEDDDGPAFDVPKPEFPKMIGWKYDIMLWLFSGTLLLCWTLVFKGKDEAGQG